MAEPWVSDLQIEAIFDPWHKDAARHLLAVQARAISEYVLATAHHGSDVMAAEILKRAGVE